MTTHYIARVQDSINDYREVQSAYCDVDTFGQAVKHFKQEKCIKRYLGDKRYQITIQPNPFVMQWPE